MRRWFLSYHSPDQALAEGLKRAIERQDSGSNVFFAPTHLQLGGSWSAQLAKEIADAHTFVLLVGPHGIGNWQVLEYDEALEKWAQAPSGFPLIVVLLEGQTAPGLPFLRRLHWIITPDPASDKEVARLFEASSGSRSNTGELWRYTSPYRGLEAMQEKDSDYFFGRPRARNGRGPFGGRRRSRPSPHSFRLFRGGQVLARPGRRARGPQASGLAAGL